MEPGPSRRDPPTVRMAGWRCPHASSSPSPTTPRCRGHLRPAVAPGGHLAHPPLGSVDRAILGDRVSDTAVLSHPRPSRKSRNPMGYVALIVDTDNADIRTWARTLAPLHRRRRNATPGTPPRRRPARQPHRGLDRHGRGAFQARGLDASIANPLVEASVAKALVGHTLDHDRTAARNDRNTLLAQADLLAQTDPTGDLATLHHILTQRILTHHGHNPLPPLQGTPRRD